MANLTLEHLSCKFTTSRGPVRAVDDLTLDIADGKLVVLVGPSGSGKSTTLRLIAGLEPPSSGSILSEGRSLNHLTPRDRDVAMVFQGLALYPHMTVQRILAFGLKMRGVPKSTRNLAVRDAAEQLGLSHLLHRKPHQLSGGERQRVALGRALVRKPRFFLLDEPLASLDPSLRAAARAEIKRIQRELGTTTVYVTHDQEEAMTLADQIAIIDRGRLQQFAAPLEVFNAPANRFVAGFFGSPPMNFFRGRIQNKSARTCFFAEGMQTPLPLHHIQFPTRIANEEIVLGVRPHEWRRGAAPNGFSAVVRAVEILGDALIAHVNAGGTQELVVKFPSVERIRTGETLQLEFPPGGLHFFAADATGRRLS